MTLSEIRKRYPEYNDLSDQALADAFHSKFYSDIPRADFDQKIGLGKTAAEPGFLQRTGEVAKQLLKQVSPGIAAITAPREQQQALTVTGLSALNTAAFGLPEMGARAVGAGPSIEAARQAYPEEAAVGDLAGLAFPAAAGYKAAGAVGRAFRGSAPASGLTNQAVGVGAKSAFGALPAAQVAAGGAGAARTPESPVAGAVASSSQLGQTVAGAPLLRQIPGYSAAVRDVGQAVPYAIGLGGAQLDRYLDTDRLIREEAARRALGQQ